MNHELLNNLKKHHRHYLALSREYRTNPPTGCTNPGYWASYYRGQAMIWARLINKAVQR